MILVSFNGVNTYMSVQFLYYQIWNSIVILEIFFFLIGSGECVLSSKTLIQLMATDVESLITSKLIPDVIGNFFLFFACKNHIFFLQMHHHSRPSLQLSMKITLLWIMEMWLHQKLFLINLSTCIGLLNKENYTHWWWLVSKRLMFFYFIC